MVKPWLYKCIALSGTRVVRFSFMSLMTNVNKMVVDNRLWFTFSAKSGLHIRIAFFMATTAILMIVAPMMP